MTNHHELSLLLHSKERKRKEMQDIARIEGIESSNVLITSEELDGLINKYERIKKPLNILS